MKHIKQLDGLRFVAVFLVLIEHFAKIIGNYISAGFYGVDLFFVISGFLITPILLNSEDSLLRAYKRFIGRRTLRIFPIYYLTIFILFLINNEYVKEYIIFCLTYTYNYAGIYYNLPESPIDHFWSLCVEEQFYLFWPFIILGLRKNGSTLKLIISAIILICGLQLMFGIIKFIVPYNNVGLIPRAYSLSIGALGAILYYENKIPSRIFKFKQLEYIVLLILIICLISSNKIQMIICPLCSLFLIIKTAEGGFLIKPIDNFLNNKIIIYLGSISYGIYVYHFPLRYYFTKYIFNPYIWDKINFNTLGYFKFIEWHSWIIKFPMISLISILIAHLSFKYFESPILKLKDKYFR